MADLSSYMRDLMNRINDINKKQINESKFKFANRPISDNLARQAARTTGYGTSSRKLKESNPVKLSRITSPDYVEIITSAIDNLPATLKQISPTSYRTLMNLSHNTVIESALVTPWMMFSTGGNGFSLQATIFVTLNFDDNDRQDDFDTTAEFPIKMDGVINDDKSITFTKVELDTSSYYD